MKTTTKTLYNRKAGNTVINEKQNDLAIALLADAQTAKINPHEINFSPFNYRKYFSEEALQQFADEVKAHGIISPLTIRSVSNNQYELVVGERRLRAARLAGLLSIPVAIVELSDEQVIEIQLSENIQRENPHPMDEAKGIGQMQVNGRTIDEIAGRLGRSKQFVFARLKLLSLIEPFQEMLYENKIPLQDALQIATLSKESQNEFFSEHCKNWQKQKNFEIYNLDYYLNRYRYDLKRAPFNIKDKNLVVGVGACSGCPSNSASLKTLFPEMAKEAICSNRECYNNKCHVHFQGLLSHSIATCQPVALIYENQLTDMAEKIIALIPGATDLPQYNYHDVSVIEKPDKPDEQDYTYEDDDENPELDKEEFAQAMEEYDSELEAYKLHMESGHYKVGILLDNKTFEPVYFSLDKPKQFHHGAQCIKAKDVQAAIKEGTATPALLEAEIDRLQQREERAEELDAEKVQLTVHNQFTEFAGITGNNVTLTRADMTGARLIIYQSLDYHARNQVCETLLAVSGTNERADDSVEHLYERLSNLTEQEFTYLIRMAICAKSESKYPFQQAGYFLYRMATDAGIPVKTIEDAQSEKRKVRKEKMQGKIKDLKKKIDKLKTK